MVFILRDDRCILEFLLFVIHEAWWTSTAKESSRQTVEWLGLLAKTFSSDQKLTESQRPVEAHLYQLFFTQLCYEFKSTPAWSLLHQVSTH